MLQTKPIAMYYLLLALKGCLILGMFSFTGNLSAEESEAKKYTNYGKAWRHQALDRQRRIIFDNDGNEALMKCKTIDAEELLRARTSGLVGSQVDTIYYCSNAGFGTCSRASDAWDIFDTKEDRYAGNLTREYIESGLDPLDIMIEFGNRHNIEVFSTIRMNDTHDASTQPYGPIRFRNNPFKVKHPEYLLGAINKKPKHGGWAAVNYAIPEVRESFLAYYKENCERFDIDGISLDFFRHPVFFPSTASGKKATEKECAMMTNMLRNVRSIAEETGKKRGRPILMSVRVPDSAEYCKAIGLDIETWLKDDLIDIMLVASYFQLNNWKYSVELGHKYGVKVYPSLDESRVRDPAARELRTSNLAYRGRAANIWQSGADGVAFFNYFNPNGKVWRECGDYALLKKLDKDYFASVRGKNNAAGGNLPYSDYQQVETLNPHNSKKITPGDSGVAHIHFGEKWEEDDPVHLEMRLQFKNLESPDQIMIHINGEPVTEMQQAEKWIACAPPRWKCFEGLNQVSVALNGTAKEKLVWTDLMLKVRYSE